MSLGLLERYRSSWRSRSARFVSQDVLERYRIGFMRMLGDSFHERGCT